MTEIVGEWVNREDLVALLRLELSVKSKRRGRVWCGVRPIGGGTEQQPLCLFGPVELPFFIRLMARGLVSLPDWNLNWFVHLFFCVPAPCSTPAAAVCHLNNKCRWSPDLVRGAGLWCILILLHSALYQGPSFIRIKEVEFKNSQCFTWIQIASIYCIEWWNGRQLCPSPPTTSHKSKKKDSPLALKDLSYSTCGTRGIPQFLDS